MSSRINAQNIKFIPDFEPDFQYEINIADFSINASQNRNLLQSPLSIGDVAPNFILTEDNGWKQLTNDSTISLNQLIQDKPLVISFYSSEWGDYGDLHLEILERAYKKITDLGGELIVFTTESTKDILHIKNDKNLSFTLVHDISNSIAELFGVYSILQPLWKRVSGINGDVPLPSTFVISQNQVIIYDFVNENLDEVFAVKDVLTAIYSIENIKQYA